MPPARLRRAHRASRLACQGANGIPFALPSSVPRILRIPRTFSRRIPRIPRTFSRGRGSFDEFIPKPDDSFDLGASRFQLAAQSTNVNVD